MSRRASSPLDSVHLPIAFEPIYLPVCDSARAQAVSRARAGAPEGTLVWAGAQQAAQARVAEWHSPDGGLYCALILRADLPAHRLAELVPVATVALGTAIAEQVAAMAELRYRWPNSVYINAARIAGVWLDTGSDWQVLACGVNVEQSPRGDFDCACLREEGGVPDLDVKGLLAGYTRQLLAWLTRWDEEGPASALHHLRSRAQRPGDLLTLRLPDGGALSGEFAAIADDGALELATEAGMQRIAMERYLGVG